ELTVIEIKPARANSVFRLLIPKANQLYRLFGGLDADIPAVLEHVVFESLGSFRSLILLRQNAESGSEGLSMDKNPHHICPKSQDQALVVLYGRITAEFEILRYVGVPSLECFVQLHQRFQRRVGERSC